MYPKLQLIIGRVVSVWGTPLGRAYWEGSDSATAIALRFRLPVHLVWEKSGPGRMIDGSCRDCGGPLIVATREEALRIAEARFEPQCVYCGSRTLQHIERAIASW